MSSIPKKSSAARIYGGLPAEKSRLQASNITLPIGTGYLLTDKGIGKQRNEDVIFICPQQHALGVIDGIGGHGDGHLAARFCADAITQNTDPSSSLVDKLEQADHHLKQLAQKKIISNDAGCCVCMLQTMGINKAQKQISLQLGCVGDCKILVLRPTNTQFGVLYDSDDHPGGLSYLLKQRFSDRIQQQLHTQHYFHRRHQVSNPVCALPTQKPKIILPPVITLTEGDIILMMSDGIADNLASDEIITILRSCKTFSAKHFVQIIFSTTSYRQRYFFHQDAESDRRLASQYGKIQTDSCPGFINNTPSTSNPAWLQPAKLDNNALLCIQVQP